MRGHRVQNKYTINFAKKIQEAMPQPGLVERSETERASSISTTYDEKRKKNFENIYRFRRWSAIIFYACYKNLK
jgi:hypothetical protein